MYPSHLHSVQQVLSENVLPKSRVSHLEKFGHLKETNWKVFTECFAQGTTRRSFQLNSQSKWSPDVFSKQLSKLTVETSVKFPDA